MSRKRCSRSASAASARLWSSISLTVPEARVARPAALRSVTRPVARTQRQPPLSMRTRQSTWQMVFSPFRPATSSWRTAGPSSGRTSSLTAVPLAAPLDAPAPLPLADGLPALQAGDQLLAHRRPVLGVDQLVHVGAAHHPGDRAPAEEARPARAHGA